MIFCLFGYLLEPYSTKFLKHPFSGWGWLGYIVVALLSFYNAPIGMYVNRYGCKPYFIVVAIIGILSTWDIACSMKGANFFSFLGKYSIIIYVTHLPLLTLLHRVVRFFITGTLENHGMYPNFFITFLILFTTEAIILPLCIKYFSFLFGMGKKE